MVIKVNLSKFYRRRKVSVTPGASMIDFGKGAAIKDPPLPARPAGPARPSELIDHGKAPRSEESRSPLPEVPRRPSALIDHGKAPRNEGSMSPLPPSAAPQPSTLIDLGKVS